MTLTEITAAIQSIKTGIKIVRGFNELKSEFEIKSATSELLNAIIDVQNNLLSIQSSYQVLLDSKNEIEKELDNFKNWETIKLNHNLKQVAPGVFVYVRKESQESYDNQYWLCANCFSNQKFSIFQSRIPGNVEDFICHSCKAKISLPSKNNPSKINRGGSWMSS